MVGKRGEIYAPKKLREMAGINPGDRLVITYEGGRIVIEKKPSGLDLLRRPPLPVRPVTPNEMVELRRELSGELEGR